MDAKKMAERAKGNVDRSFLEGSGTGGILSTGYFGDGPVIDHLRSGEQIEYVLQNLTKGLVVQKKGVEETIGADTNLRTALLVTDVRLLYVVGKSDGDETFSVPLEEGIDVDISTGFLKNRITVHAKSGTYDMYAQKGPDVHAISDYIETASTPDPEPTNIDLTRQADSAGGSPPEEAPTDVDDQQDPDRREPGSDPTGIDVSEVLPQTAPRNTHEKAGIVSDTPMQPKVKHDGRISETSESTLEILVSDQDGAPIDGATVDMTGSTFEANGRTSETGRCEITLPAISGTVDLTINHPEYTSAKAKVPVSDGAVIDVALEPDGKSSVTGTSTDEHTEASPDSDAEDAEATQENLLEELTTLNESSSKQVTRGRMRADGKFDPEDYEDEFESWSAALDVATLSDDNDGEESSNRGDQQETYTKEDIIDAIADVIETVDRRPSTVEMNKYGEISPSPAYRYFDSWSNAVDAAEKQLGGQSQDRTEAKYTKEDVVKKVADVASMVGERPSTTDFQAHAEMTTSSIFRYFDTWDDAVSTALDEYDVDVGKDSAADESEADDDQADPNASEGSASGDVEFEWGESMDTPMAADIEKVPEGRLSDVCVGIVEVRDGVGSKREVVMEVESAAGKRLDLAIWKKHDVDFDVEVGDTLRLDEVRLKRWDGNNGYEHELSSTKDLSVTVVEDGQSGGDSPSTEGDDVDEQEEALLPRFVGIGGSTESEAEALVEAGYSTKDDLKEASLEELRSIDGLDDGTALRMKAEFG